METEAETDVQQLNPRFLIGTVIFLIVAGIVLLLALYNPTSNSSGLLPILATPTIPQSDEEIVAPVPVTFTELNSDPLAYLNLPIQVSGTYLRLDPQTCPRYSGPLLAWAIVSEDLQLDVKGFERVVRILTPGTEMTLQGIWRLYQGPLGCGKGPEPGSAWYLQVLRIVQPNPLVGDGSGSKMDITSGGAGLPDLLPTAIPTETLPATATMEIVTPSATAPQSDFAPTITVEIPEALTPAATTQLPTPTPVTFTPTPGAVTPGPSASPGPSPTPGSGGGNPNVTSTPMTPLPPTSTQTSGGGYDGPATITPTASPNPYQ
ncbi:MAG: hypothetical protein ACK2UR_06945 [Candidatus Promineifilaceae bacterium]|jgi:hypothetical protein